MYENKTSIYKSQYQHDAYIKFIKEMSYFSRSATDYRYVFSKNSTVYTPYHFLCFNLFQFSLFHFWQKKHEHKKGTTPTMKKFLNFLKVEKGQESQYIVPESA